MKAISLVCDNCGSQFEIENSRVIQNSQVYFCRKRCYIQYCDEWNDVIDPELLDQLPGDYPDLHSM